MADYECDKCGLCCRKLIIEIEKCQELRAEHGLLPLELR